MAHVLVVDDRAANRDLLGYLFDYFGHRVTLVSNGADALASARTDRPDLVVIDLAMPGIDGYDTARQIRLDLSLTGVALVAVSASNSATPEAASDAGFDAFYPLPIDPQGFVATLGPLLPPPTGE